MTVPKLFEAVCFDAGEEHEEWSFRLDGEEFHTSRGDEGDNHIAAHGMFESLAGVFGADVVYVNSDGTPYKFDDGTLAKLPKDYVFKES